MKACLRWCCPCCLRGEPEEKQRVKVAYGVAKDSNADENVNLLKPEELQEDTVKENGGTVVKSDSDEEVQEEEDTKEDVDIEDEDDDTMWYTDENGRRVRRVLTTVTTTSTKTTSENGDDGKHLTRDVLQMEGNYGGVDKDEDVEVREFVDENGRKVRRIIKKTIVTTTTTRKTTSNNDGPSNKEISSGEVPLQFGSKPPVHEVSKMDLDIRGQPFGNHDIKFTTRGHTTISTESTGGNNHGNSTSYHRSVFTKTIGGDGGTTVVEHSTKSFGRGDDHPITAVTKESRIHVPEWMEEKPSPESTRRSHGTSDISVHLNYPRDFTPKKEPEPVANESRINPQVAKREKPVIDILSLGDVVREKEKEKKEEKPPSPQPPPTEEEEEEEEESEEEDEEYDEFEEEIVVLEVQRKPRYHRGLEIPKDEPEKDVIPVEDLLAVPVLEKLQESAPIDFIEEEKVEAVERPPVNECPLDFSSFEE